MRDRRALARLFALFMALSLIAAACGGDDDDDTVGGDQPTTTEAQGNPEPGGTLVLDDFYPPLEFWPEEAAPRDVDGRSITVARQHWLQHPELFATEVRVHPQASAILATRKAPRS